MAGNNTIIDPITEGLNWRLGWEQKQGRTIKFSKEEELEYKYFHRRYTPFIERFAEYAEKAISNLPLSKNERFLEYAGKTMQPIIYILDKAFGIQEEDKEYRPSGFECLM